MEDFPKILEDLGSYSLVDSLMLELFKMSN